MTAASAERLIFSLRHRVVLPAAEASPGEDSRDDSAAAARQVDAVLMTAGFKCSGPLLSALGARGPGQVIDLGVQLIGWARELAGGHVQHNAYFIDFPANVPDTLEFWLGLLRDAIAVDAGPASPEGAAGPAGALDLLSLPAYGRYQHSYADMLARHDELIPALSDRRTVLHLGGPAADEAAALYAELAGSAVPLSGQERDALRFLADYHGGALPAGIPVRENRAIVNAARVRAGAAPQVDTPTDVLRIAAELSGADVTLTRPPRFRSLPRPQRRALLAALDDVAGQAPGKLADVAPHAESWKRLGERLHPHEWAATGGSADVFAVARGEKDAPTRAGRAERAFAAGDVVRAAQALAVAPGMLWRAADRVLRAAAAQGTAPDAVLAQFAATAPHVSGRVLLSVREHLQNRLSAGDPVASRIFVNRAGRGYVVPEARPPVEPAAARRLLELIDAEVTTRLPDPGELITDPAIAAVALPLSGKATADGLYQFPRGSVTPVEGDLLRFFIYWKQRQRRTDFDLSALITDENLGNETWLSYTNLSNYAGEHSGDITDAPDGASEFINLQLASLGRNVVIPQVYVFSGEGFTEVAENFFGFMTLGAQQRGAPFEPATVRARSVLTGAGRTAMPLAFYRGEDGRWRAKWLHLYLAGRSSAWGGVRVEENRVTSRLLAQSILRRDYLRVGYLIGLLRRKASPAGTPPTYIGVAQPADLPDGTRIYTLANLASLVPG